MSTAERAREMTPEVRELEIANTTGTWKTLEQEWHNLRHKTEDARAALHASEVYAKWKAVDEELAAKAREFRACGERLSELERAHGLRDDYANGSNHVKVGT